MGGQLQAIMNYRFAATGEYVINFETSDDLDNWRIIRSENVQSLDAATSYFDVQSTIDVPTPPTGASFFRSTITKTGPGGSPLESN